MAIFNICKFPYFPLNIYVRDFILIVQILFGSSDQKLRASKQNLRLCTQEPLNQRTYHADDFVLAPVVVAVTH
jgi:hypothetical protein